MNNKKIFTSVAILLGHFNGIAAAADFKVTLDTLSAVLEP